MLCRCRCPTCREPSPFTTASAMKVNFALEEVIGLAQQQRQQQQQQKAKAHQQQKAAAAAAGAAVAKCHECGTLQPLSVCFGIHLRSEGACLGFFSCDLVLLPGSCCQMPKPPRCIVPSAMQICAKAAAPSFTQVES